MAIPGAYVYPQGPPLPDVVPGGTVAVDPLAVPLSTVRGGRRGRPAGLSPGAAELDRLLGGDGRRSGVPGVPGAPAGGVGGYDDGDGDDFGGGAGFGRVDDGDDDGFARRQLAAAATPGVSIPPFAAGRDALKGGSEGYRSLLFGSGIGRASAGGSARQAAAGGAGGGAGVSAGAGTGGWLTRLSRHFDD